MIHKLTLRAFVKSLGDDAHRIPEMEWHGYSREYGATNVVYPDGTRVVVSDAMVKSAQAWASPIRKVAPGTPFIPAKTGSFKPMPWESIQEYLGLTPNKSAKDTRRLGGTGDEAQAGDGPASD